MEGSRFIKVTGKTTHSTIVMPVLSVREVFEDKGGVFIVTRWRKFGRGCVGFYVIETMEEVVAKLGAV